MRKRVLYDEVAVVPHKVGAEHHWTLEMIRVFVEETMDLPGITAVHVYESRISCRGNLSETDHSVSKNYEEETDGPDLPEVQ